MKPKIFLGSDHAGFKLKQELIEFLENEGYEVEDIGPEKYNKGDDYPSFIIPTAKKVAEVDNAKGIVLGKSGQGEAIAANKVDGIRAALYYGQEEDIVRLSREHNNANILSLGSDFISEENAKEVVLEWLNTEFKAKERHERRLNELRNYEKKKSPMVMPAILAETQEELDEEFEKVVQYSECFHVDVEDGKFVEGTALDFDYSLPENQYYEAHLMMEDPLKWIKKNIDQFEVFTFHIESENKPEKVIDYLIDHNRQVGIAINPDTDMDEILGYTHKVDKVQIMTVDPGSYGSEFHEEMISRIERVREKHPWLDIQVDGHVTEENISDLEEAGANLFVSGSYLQNAEDPGKAVRKLEKEINTR